MRNRVELVLDHYQIDYAPRNNSDEILFLCPFHNDTHLGSTMFNSEKEIFHCWACGEKGNIFEFVSRLSNCTIKEAEALINSNFRDKNIVDFYVRDVNDIQEKTIRNEYETLATKITTKIFDVIKNKQTPFSFTSFWINMLPWIYYDHEDKLKKEKELLLLYKQFLEDLQQFNQGENNVKATT